MKIIDVPSGLLPAGYEPWVVRFVRALWPKSRSIVGMVVDKSPSFTVLIKSGDIYQALHGGQNGSVQM